MGWIESWIRHNPHLRGTRKESGCCYRGEPLWFVTTSRRKATWGGVFLRCDLLSTIPTSWDMAGTACPQSTGCMCQESHIFTHSSPWEVWKHWPEVITFLQKHTQAVTVVRRIALWVPRNEEPAFKGKKSHWKVTSGQMAKEDSKSPSNIMDSAHPELWLLLHLLLLVL